MSSSLSVVIDGRRLPEEEARPMWERFSKYMDEHQGDFDGFAREAGFASARVAVAGSVPTLTLSSTDAPAPEKKPPGQKRGRRGKRRRR